MPGGTASLDPIIDLQRRFGVDDVLLTRREAAQLCRRSPMSLQRWIRLGGGPPTVRISGRHMYPLKPLKMFLGLA